MSTPGFQRRPQRSQSGAGRLPGPKNERLCNLDRVIFLDVDGVLHPAYVQYQRQQFRPSNMALLKGLLETSKATLVLSSSWRQNMEAKEHLRQVFNHFGIQHWVSQTPSIGMYARAREILTWVGKYTPRTWVAIDDWHLLMESKLLQGHFLQTNPKVGLTPQNIDRILNLFAAQDASMEHRENQMCAPESPNDGSQQSSRKEQSRKNSKTHSQTSRSGNQDSTAFGQVSNLLMKSSSMGDQDFLNTTLEEAIQVSRVNTSRRHLSMSPERPDKHTNPHLLHASPKLGKQRMVHPNNNTMGLTLQQGKKNQNRVEPNFLTSTASGSFGTRSKNSSSQQNLRQIQLRQAQMELGRRVTQKLEGGVFA